MLTVEDHACLVDNPEEAQEWSQLATRASEDDQGRAEGAHGDD